MSGMKQTSYNFEGELRRLLRRRPAPAQRVDITPGCPFGAVVEQRLKDLERNIGEVKARVSGLIFLVAGAVIVEIALRLLT